MNNQIVIIRYNEDISWAECLENVIIYNKGEKLNTKHKVVNLPNLGMFSASQFFHCIENYDNLADRTLFFPGNPWDGVFEVRNNYTNTPENTIKLINRYFDFPEGEHASSNYISQLIGDIYNGPPNYNQRHHNYFITYDLMWKEWIDNYIDPLKKINWWKPVRMYKNGHMALSREAIRSNCKEYYIKLMELLPYDVPVTEWSLESTNNFVFNVANNGNIIDLGHNNLNFDNLKDYRTWHSEII